MKPAKPARPPKAKANGAAPKSAKGGRKPIERVACQTCGKKIAAYKQGRHKCKPADVAAFSTTH